ncbi:carotenoid oxygenase family protein [Streptomyces sp. NBC_00083]|uniref:carotenoid oxygenase family protein n=1 Tax=Streptomyces sp. NBC_00083 TaxID=2975647 RepID=UPI00225845E8|nr:carotenoid oxygenase family protein [Streptomyces sp. NBC_00083]MCX5387318.1 carotenoid oxygenase family protein [Streptomyces sp. NBC_00083]
MSARTQPGFDPTRVPHLLGSFAPVTEEVDAIDLEVTGDIPSSLDGLYVRNGPNPRFTPIGSYLYPIDGDGMLHGVWLSEGRARYRNRFVRTPGLLAEERVGHALWGGLESFVLPGPDVVGPELANEFKDLPDINVVSHAGRLMALAESACPFRMDDELETVGREDFGGALPVGITAHPKIDPVTGEMVVFCYALEAPYLTWSIIDPTGVVIRKATPVEGVDEPMMIHDMALTKRYIVLVLSPVFIDLEGAMSGGSFLAWRPERGTRVALIPRDGGRVRWASDEAFWLWHTVNAYDDGPEGEGDVVLEYVQWSRLTVGSASAASSADPVRCNLVRARIDPVAGRMARTDIDDARVELPRIDDRRIGRRHRFLALAARVEGPDLLPGEFNALRWYDTETNTASVWPAGDLSVGEPVFAPEPGRPSDERGHWLTFATDRTDGTSWFLVIPAEDPASGPVARVRIPVRVPLGLHGSWLPT